MTAVFWDFRSHKRRIHVLRFFGFFGDTENTELPEEKVHRRYKCLLSYRTAVGVMCGRDYVYNETRPCDLMARPGYW
jgi:UPF0288 family protein (methanogenesis marker protein 3)